MSAVQITLVCLTLAVVVVLVCLTGGRASLEWAQEDDPGQEAEVRRALELCALRSTVVLMAADTFYVCPLNGVGVTVSRSGLSDRDHEHLRSLVR